MAGCIVACHGSRNNVSRRVEEEQIAPHNELASRPHFDLTNWAGKRDPRIPNRNPNYVIPTTGCIELQNSHTSSKVWYSFVRYANTMVLSRMAILLANLNGH